MHIPTNCAVNVKVGFTVSGGSLLAVEPTVATADKGPYTNHVALRGGGGQAKHHVKPRGRRGCLAENHVTFFPIFAFLFPTKQGNCHLLRALNQATTTLWEAEVEKDSIF